VSPPYVDVTTCSYMILAGIDVSNYQSISSSQWKTIAANGVSFVFIKATEGTGQRLPYELLSPHLIDDSCRLPKSSILVPV
jgi:hypothetical protein